VVSAAVVGLLIVLAVRAVVTQPGFEWDVVGEYLFHRDVLVGVWVTIYLTVSAMVIGVIVGIVIAIMHRSDNRLLSTTASLFIWAFRGVPTLVQLLLWFNLAALFPTVGLSIPFGGPELFSASPNSFMTPFLAAMLGLGLCEGAYMAEIVRGGLLSVDVGQHEAAAALGLTQSQILRKVVMPQAMRTIIPPTGNEVIAMLKYTSLASVISVTELLQSTQQIYQRTFAIIPLLIVASFWYLVLTTALTVGQGWLERRFGRGVAARSRPMKPMRPNTRRPRPSTAPHVELTETEPR
jgi:polar amino acid transport system permease protein